MTKEELNVEMEFLYHTLEQRTTDLLIEIQKVGNATSEVVDRHVDKVLQTLAAIDMAKRVKHVIEEER